MNNLLELHNCIDKAHTLQMGQLANVYDKALCLPQPNGTGAQSINHIIQLS